jgi:P4 family phage/plasmid primase-like protien
MVTADEIKRSIVDIEWIVQKLNLKAKRTSSGYRINCPNPEHNDSNPSCLLSIGERGTLRAYCFSCGYSEDVIGLTQTVLDCGFPEAMVFLSGDEYIDHRVPNIPENREIECLYKSSQELVGIYNNHTFPTNTIKDWTKERRLPDEIFEQNLCRTIIKRNIGQAPRWFRYFRETNYNLIIPLYDHTGQQVNFLARYTGKAKDVSKTRFVKGSRKKGALLMNNEARNYFSSQKRGESLFVFEGEVDFLTMATELVPAIGIPGNGSLDDNLFCKIDNFDTVYICTDNDIAGKRYAKLIVDRTGMCECRRFLPPEGMDVNDMANDISAEKIRQESKQIRKKKKDIPHEIMYKIIQEDYGGLDKIVRNGEKSYWRYNGIYWEVLSDPLLEKTILDKIESYRPVIFNKDRTLSSVKRLLKAKIGANVELFGTSNHDNSIINCNNCEIWIDGRTGNFEIREHRPENYLHFCIDVDYDVDARCPLWLETLDGIFRDHTDRQGTIDYLQELFGYTIQSCKNIAAWVLFRGGGDNGKSLVLGILSRLLGKSVLSKSINEFSSTNLRSLASLVGKLAVIDDDVESRTVLPDGIMKKLSENKPLSARFLYKEEFEMYNRAIIYMATNPVISCRDLSYGMSRRANVIDFNRRFNRDEKDINREHNIAETELSGILNWSLNGLQRLRQRGEFEPSIDCDQAKDDWITSASPIAQFIQSSCETGDDNYIVLPDDLWEEYKIWNDEEGLRSYGRSRRSFHHAIKERGFKRQKINDGLFNRPTEYYIGIRLKSKLDGGY